jgi:hypothetical protein
MRRLAFVLFFFAAIWMLSAAGETNYFCVVCGKGPLTGRIWMTKWGPICDDCYHLKDHCSICGLPIKDGDGHVQTADGRLICRFDKTNAVLDVDEAKELFAGTRRDVVEMYGQGFALQTPDVAVTMFDVDYWSEKNGANGLHKFGFASTRKTSGGKCTHEVVMLSGRLRDEMISVAAHEYTHLWINENRPDGRVIDGDTTEAICELTAYNLMGEKNLPEMQQRILNNPYTHGRIKTLIAVYQEHGIGYILNWVKNGTAENFDDAGGAQIVAAPSIPFSAAPPQLPAGLKFSGVLVIGSSRQAVINGAAFAAGDEKRLKLRSKTALVRCRQIGDESVVVEINDSPENVTLKKGDEIPVP